jgi:hypothetical protein
MRLFAIDLLVLFEVLLGAVFCLYAAMAFFGDHGHHGLLPAFSCSVIALVLFGIAGLLRRGVASSYWASWAVGLAMLWCGSFCIWDSLRLKPSYTGEEGFGFLIGFALLTLALVGLIILSLPMTRRFFFNANPAAVEHAG